MSSSALQQTEEMRGIAPKTSKQLEEARAYSAYLNNSMINYNNNFNFYKYHRLSQYVPDNTDYSRLPSDYGSSKYDASADLPTLYNNGLADWRAQNQGWGLELLASLGQFGTRAVGTVLEGVSLPVGMLVGGIKHAADYIENDPARPEEEKHNLLYDIIFNPISQGINKAQDALIESMPIYKTQEELDNSWWTNVVRHPFTWFFADALPSIGFTVGAMVGGKIHGKAVESLLGKALGKKDILDKAAKLGIALEEVPDEQIPKLISDLKNSTATEKLGILNKYLKNERIKNSMSNWAGILNASATEATVEGYNTRKEYIDSILPKAYDYMKSDYFQNQLKSNFQKDNEGFTDFEDYRAEKEREVIQNIVKTADNIGLTTWGANLAFLSAHNKFFWDSFFNPKFMLKNSVRDYTKLFKVTGKDGLVSDVALKNSFWINHPKLGKAAFIAKNGLAEAFEEMSQGLFSESAKEGFGSKMNDIFFDDYNMLLDPRYSQKSTGFWGAVGKGFQETYLNPERWEEGMIGFLTGMIGLPNMGVHQKGARQGKKGITGWTFGGTEEWKAYQDKYKRAEEMAKQFRTNEGDERDAYMSVKDYLTGTESKEMQSLNALGKSPMDMLRTGVVLNAIRDIASEDKSSDAPDENNFIELLTWKNKVMSGILMGYDTYVQMGISDYFDNWLNFLQNINKPQNNTKAEQFIKELEESGVLSAIVSKDNQPLIKNYNQRNKDKLLGSIAKNASDIKKLLDLYSDIEAEAYDVLVNNFKGDPNAYSKVKALLRALTKAKFSERLIFSDSNEERLPKLNSKADFYNLKGFDKLYDVAGKKDKKEEERKAIEEVKESYKEKLGEGEVFNEQKFDEYVFDIIVSDKMQEEIYKITNPTAFNEAAKKAAEKTEKAVEKREVESFKKKVVSALSENSSMTSDSQIVDSIFEAGRTPEGFNSKLIFDIPDDWGGIKKYLGVTEAFKSDNAKSKRFERLLKEIKNYTLLVTDTIPNLLNKQLTDAEKEQLNKIKTFLEEGGMFNNVHQKYNDLFNEYFALRHERIMSKDNKFVDDNTRTASQKEALFNILSDFKLVKDLEEFFDRCEKEFNQSKDRPEGAYQFFTYTKWKSNKPEQTPEKNDVVQQGSQTHGVTESQQIKSGALREFLNKLYNIVTKRDLSNLLSTTIIGQDVLNLSDDDNFSLSIQSFNEDTFSDVTEKIVLNKDNKNIWTVSSSELSQPITIKRGNLQDLDKLYNNSAFAVFTKPSEDTYSVGCIFLDFELMSPKNINKLRKGKNNSWFELSEEEKAELIQFYNEYEFTVKTKGALNKDSNQQSQTATQPQTQQQGQPQGQAQTNYVLNSKGEILPNIGLTPYAFSVLDILNNNPIASIQGYENIKSLIPKGPAGYYFEFPDSPSPSTFNVGVFKFLPNTQIKNVTIQGRTWDIQISKVDENGQLLSIAPVERTGLAGKEILSYENGQFKVTSVSSPAPPTVPLKDGDITPFPITHRDYEDENKNTNYLNTTKRTDGHVKGKSPLYKYIRRVLEGSVIGYGASNAYFAMTEQLPDGSFKYNVGDSVYFKPIEFVEDANELEAELVQYYKNFKNLPKKLIGIYSSKDSSGELLGIVDPSNTAFLSMLDKNVNSISDIEYQITSMVTGKSSVLVNNQENKTSLDRLDPNNECLYVVFDGTDYFTNKPTEDDNKISKSELCKLLGIEYPNTFALSQNRIYIFSPTRNNSKFPDKRYTMAHTSVEMDSINSTSMEVTPELLRDRLSAFAEDFVNDEGDAKTESRMHEVMNMFYSTTSNFNLFLDKEGNLKLRTVNLDRDGNEIKNTEHYTEINTESADNIANGIINTMNNLGVVFSYRPSELFKNDNAWFNDLKPYLKTTKAFIGESNVYFIASPKALAETATEPIEGETQYTQPKEKVEVKAGDVEPTNKEQSKNETSTRSELFSVLENYGISTEDSYEYISELIDDISNNGAFSEESKQILSDKGLDKNQRNEIQNEFLRIINPQLDSELSDICNKI